MSKLYRVYQTTVERVPLEFSSLGESSLVDRSVVENICGSIKSKELPKGSRTIIIGRGRQDASSRNPDEAAFWGLLDQTSTTPTNLSSSTIANSPKALFEVETATMSSAFELVELERCDPTPTQHVDQLTFSDFELDASYFLYGGPCECFLWIGSRIDRDVSRRMVEYFSHPSGGGIGQIDRKINGGALSRILSSSRSVPYDLIICKPNLEPRMFKELFMSKEAASQKATIRASITGGCPPSAEIKRDHKPNVASDDSIINRVFGDTSPQAAASPKYNVVTGSSARRSSAPTINSPTNISNLPSISSEMNKIVSRNVGSWSHSQQGLLDSIKNLNSKLLVDDSRQLRRWEVNATSKSSRDIRMIETDINHALFSVVSTDGGYVILYSCKNNSRHIAFIVIGDECEPTRRAALALQVNDLLKQAGIRGATDQVNLQTGRESQFLLSMLHSYRKPYTIINNSTLTDRFVYQVYNPAAVRGNEGLMCGSVMSRINDHCHAYSNRAYIAIDLTASSCDVLIGAHVDDCIRNSVDHAVSLFLHEGQLMAYLNEKMGQVRERESTVIQIQWPPSSSWLVTNSFACDIVDMSQSSSYSRSSSSIKVIPVSRPRRFFSISSTQRSSSTGFCLEIGPGFTFCQSDLTKEDCFLMDFGSMIDSKTIDPKNPSMLTSLTSLSSSVCGPVFVWFGCDSSYDCRSLAVRVARNYVKRLMDTLVDDITSRMNNDIIASMSTPSSPLSSPTTTTGRRSVMERTAALDRAIDDGGIQKIDVESKKNEAEDSKLMESNNVEIQRLLDQATLIRTAMNPTSGKKSSVDDYMVYLEAGQEMPGFMSCFRDWDSSLEVLHHNDQDRRVSLSGRFDARAIPDIDDEAASIEADVQRRALDSSSSSPSSTPISSPVARNETKKTSPVVKPAVVSKPTSSSPISRVSEAKSPANRQSQSPVVPVKETSKPIEKPVVSPVKPQNKSPPRSSESTRQTPINATTTANKSPPRSSESTRQSPINATTPTSHVIAKQTPVSVQTSIPMKVETKPVSKAVPSSKNNIPTADLSNRSVAVTSQPKSVPASNQANNKNVAQDAKPARAKSTAQRRSDAPFCLIL